MYCCSQNRMLAPPHGGGRTESGNATRWGATGLLNCVWWGALGRLQHALTPVADLRNRPRISTGIHASAAVPLTLMAVACHHVERTPQQSMAETTRHHSHDHSLL